MNSNVLNGILILLIIFLGRSLAIKIKRNICFIYEEDIKVFCKFFKLKNWRKYIFSDEWFEDWNNCLDGICRQFDESIEEHPCIWAGFWIETLAFILKLLQINIFPMEDILLAGSFFIFIVYSWGYMVQHFRGDVESIAITTLALCLFLGEMVKNAIENSWLSFFYNICIAFLGVSIFFHQDIKEKNSFFLLIYLFVFSIVFYLIVFVPESQTSSLSLQNAIGTNLFNIIVSIAVSRYFTLQGK